MPSIIDRSVLARLTNAFSHFELDVERLARATVEAILRKELAQRRAAPRPQRARARPAARRPRRKRAPVTPPPAAISRPPAPVPRAPKWTRDTIIVELSRFFANKISLDAAFVARHGPRGLVAAARRLFGRFDAALNVAALHWSKTSAEAEPQSPA